MIRARVSPRGSPRHTPFNLVVVGRDHSEQKASAPVTRKGRRWTVAPSIENDSLFSRSLKRLDRSNRDNCWHPVICLLSSVPTAPTQYQRNILSFGALSQMARSKTKGNIHPFTDGDLHDQTVFSEEKRTVATVKTRQTEQIVSRISSLRVNGCYQQKSLLPASAKLEWN